MATNENKVVVRSDDDESREESKKKKVKKREVFKLDKLCQCIINWLHSSCARNESSFVVSFALMR